MGFLVLDILSPMKINTRVKISWSEKKNHQANTKNQPLQFLISHHDFETKTESEYEELFSYYSVLEKPVSSKGQGQLTLIFLSLSTINSLGEVFKEVLTGAYILLSAI